MITLGNTPGTAGGPGGRDRKLAVKSRKKRKKKSVFFRENFPGSGSKAEDGEGGKKEKNTPGSAGGPGGRDRKLAVIRRKNARKSVFCRKKKIAYIF